MTRIAFVGSHLGRHPGRVTTQNEVLEPLFRAAGHSVRSTSSELGQVRRLLDVLCSLWRWRHDLDVVVISVFSGRGFLLADLASGLTRRLGLAQIQVLHGGGLPELLARRPRWVRRVLARAEAVVAPSAWLAEVVTPLGIAARVIPNVLDLSLYEDRERSSYADPAAPLLLWMRAFHDVYAPELAIACLATLRARGLDARLTMAGQDKGLEGACRAQARALGVDAWVDFPGFLDAAAKRAAFATHDVFLNTNRIDNTPVTVLEAMASGLPVVATAVGGVPHLVRQGAAGRLVALRDAEATANALADAVQDLARGGSAPAESTPTVAQLSRNGRRVAEESAWPTVRAAWERLFVELS